MSPAIAKAADVASPQPLSSTTKTTGSFQTIARFRLSAAAPWLTAPSPQKQTAAAPVPSVLAVSAAPQTGGGPPPTMPLAPGMPFSRSAMRIEPPLPLQVPVLFPRISAIIGPTAQPLAMEWPWPRWVEAMKSRVRGAMQTPTATASWPAWRCVEPGTRPACASAWTRVSKVRIVRIVR